MFYSHPVQEELTSIASRLLTTLDRFALKSFSPDHGGELETETLSEFYHADNITNSGQLQQHIVIPIWVRYLPLCWRPPSSCHCMPATPHKNLYLLAGDKFWSICWYFVPAQERMCSNFEKDKQQPQLWSLLTCGPNLNFELRLILGCLLLHVELKVQTTGPNENMAIVGMEEDGNEIVLPSEIIRKTGSSEGMYDCIGQHLHLYLISAEAASVHPRAICISVHTHAHTCTHSI